MASDGTPMDAKRPSPESASSPDSRLGGAADAAPGNTDADAALIRATLDEDWPSDHPTYMDAIAALDRLVSRLTVEEDRLGKDSGSASGADVEAGEPSGASDNRAFCPECGGEGTPEVMRGAYDDECPDGAPCRTPGGGAPATPENEAGSGSSGSAAVSGTGLLAQRFQDLAAQVARLVCVDDVPYVDDPAGRKALDRACNEIGFMLELPEPEFADLWDGREKVLPRRACTNEPTAADELSDGTTAAEPPPVSDSDSDSVAGLRARLAEAEQMGNEWGAEALAALKQLRAAEAQAARAGRVIDTLSEALQGILDAVGSHSDLGYVDAVREIARAALVQVPPRPETDEQADAGGSGAASSGGRQRSGDSE